MFMKKWYVFVDNGKKPIEWILGYDFPKKNSTKCENFFRKHQFYPKVYFDSNCKCGHGVKNKVQILKKCTSKKHHLISNF